MKRKIKFNQAINEAIYQAMDSDKKIVCYGLGVTDPRRVFYTTEKLVNHDCSQKYLEKLRLDLQNNCEKKDLHRHDYHKIAKK